MPAKQVDDLLIRVTIAIINDHFGLKVPARARIGFLFRDFRHFCRGKRAHTVFKECSIVPMGITSHNIKNVVLDVSSLLHDGQEERN